MTKEEFEKQVDMELIEKYQMNGKDKYLDYAYKEYMKKVHPFRSLITNWRVQKDDTPNLEEVRIALDLPTTLFSIYRGLDDFNNYLGMNKDMMKFKAQKDLIEAIELAKENGKINAKLLEMQLRRFDIDYTKISNGEGNDNNTPNKIKISFDDGSMSDIEISEKSGRKIKE